MTAAKYPADKCNKSRIYSFQTSKIVAVRYTDRERKIGSNGSILMSQQDRLNYIEISESSQANLQALRKYMICESTNTVSRASTIFYFEIRGRYFPDCSYCPPENRRLDVSQTSPRDRVKHSPTQQKASR